MIIFISGFLSQSEKNSIHFLTATMTARREIIFFFYVLNFFSDIKCAKLIGIFPMSGGSHFIMSSSLMRGLAEAGNDVTIVCPHEDNEPTTNGTYRSIVLDGFAENYKDDMKKLNLFEMRDFNKFTQEVVFQDHIYEKMEQLVRIPAIRKLIESNETFDAVIIEQFSNDALKAFAYIFKAHLIVFSPIGPYNEVNRLVSNPTMVAYNPQVVTTFPRPLSFMNKVRNTLIFVFEEMINHFVFLPRHDQFIQKHFPGVPSMQELNANVSLVLLNSHESVWQSIPLVPNVIPIGGFHIGAPKSLPKEIQRFLDESNDGVILVSFGSNLKISNMSDSNRRIFLDVFRNMKEKVLWKLDDEISDLPKNVKAVKWMPQREILAHHNVKLFITHGGLLSIMEAVSSGVPVLVIPVYGDQATNANNALIAGFGKYIIYHNFNEHEFRRTLTEMLSNYEYKKNAVKQSKLFHDRPMKPMDAAVYWVEYVIKYGGAPHLRVDGLHLTWFQYLLLDVIFFLFLAVSIAILLLVLFVKVLLGLKEKQREKIKKM